MQRSCSDAPIDAGLLALRRADLAWATLGLFKVTHTHPSGYAFFPLATGNRHYVPLTLEINRCNAMCGVAMIRNPP